MADKPIITVGATTLKLQTGLQPTDQQWCDLAHIRAFSSTGTDLTKAVQVDASQVQFDVPGSYQVQAFVSDPETQKIAGQSFQAVLVSLDSSTEEAPTTAPKTKPAPVRVAESEPRERTVQYKPIVEPKPDRKAQRQEARLAKKEAKETKSATKSHRHFMWTVLTLVLGILIMWLLIYVFSGRNTNQNQTGSVATTPSSSVAAQSSSHSETTASEHSSMMDDDMSDQTTSDSDNTTSNAENNGTDNTVSGIQDKVNAILGEVQSLF